MITYAMKPTIVVDACKWCPFCRLFKKMAKET